MNYSKCILQIVGLVVLVAGGSAWGAIEVDPDTVGATDVRRGSDSFLAAPIANPVPDSLVILPDNLYLGVTGDGELEVSGGSVLTGADGILGDQMGHEGKITVTGAGSVWSNVGELTVGRLGDGRLTIEDGGEVSGVGVFLATEGASTSIVEVRDPGSEFISLADLVVGGEGSFAVVNVRDGAMVDAGSSVSREVSIGSKVGAGGSVLVIGEGSSWISTASELEIGNDSFGVGQLSIGEGGYLSSMDGLLASSVSTGAAFVVVDGEGSLWEIEDNLFLSGLAGGEAILHVSNGGEVVTRDLFIRGTDADTFGSLKLLSGGKVRTQNLNMSDKGRLNLLGGELIFTGGITYTGEDNNEDINAVLAPRGGVLSLGETVGVESSLRVEAPIVVDGGKLSASSYINFGLVELRRGVLEMTGVDLDVSSTGPRGDTIALDRGQHMKVGMTVHVASDGRVELDGGRLGAGVLSNAGVVTGDGRIDGPLANLAGGEVQSDMGNSLLFTGAGSTNNGDISLLGGRVQFDQDLTNNVAGRINGRGTLVANGGLTNNGQVRFSGGFADVFGDVVVTSGALVRVDGGGVATFYDDVQNEGTFQTSSTSEVVFLGAVTGSGDFSSGGTVVFEGDFSPGSSPGEVLIDGSMVLGDASRLVLELGGDVQGESYDHVVVSERLGAAGTLEVLLIDGFIPSAGDRFDLLEFGSISGKFEKLQLPKLAGNLHFDTSTLLTDGALSVVPEPGTAGLLLVLTAGMRLPYRRRS